MRIEAFVDGGLNAAVFTHLYDFDAPSISAGKHPVPFLKCGDYAFNCTFRAEWLATSDAMEGILFLQDALRRIPGPEIEPRLQRNGVLGAGRFAQPALDADAFSEAQHCAIWIVRQCAGRTGVHTGVAKRAGVDIQQHSSEWRARCERHDIDG